MPHTFDSPQAQASARSADFPVGARVTDGSLFGRVISAHNLPHYKAATFCSYGGVFARVDHSAPGRTHGPYVAILTDSGDYTTRGIGIVRNLDVDLDQKAILFAPSDVTKAETARLRSQLDQAHATIESLRRSLEMSRRGRNQQRVRAQEAERNLRDVRALRGASSPTQYVGVRLDEGGFPADYDFTYALPPGVSARVFDRVIAPVGRMNRRVQGTVSKVYGTTPPHCPVPIKALIEVS